MGGIFVLGFAAMLSSNSPLAAQNPNSPQATNPPVAQTTPPANGAASPPPSLDNYLDAGEAEDVGPVRSLVSWNEYQGKYFSIALGGGFLYDYAAFAQDDESKQQFAMLPAEKVRDARFTLRGQLKFFKKRMVTYTSGFMYDGPSGKFLVRETGLMVEVPKLLGYLFAGRTKEGFSLNKVMVGYAGWTMERFTTNDATIPILADGVKWLGYSEKAHLIWNAGFYLDGISQGQSFSTYDHQFSGRIAWVPLMSEKTGKVLHIGTSLRYGVPKDKQIQLRSRPEAFTAPYFIDTSKFPAESTRMIGPEIYYRPHSWLFGSEYFFQKVNAPASGNPLFQGGDVVVTWLATGETRVYNTRGAFFNQVSPARPVFKGGPGAWELVGRFSYIDLNGGTIRGGKFWRITPMVSWHLSDNMRLEFAYGYGSLNRFELNGRTSFFQSRIQLQL